MTAPSTEIPEEIDDDLDELSEILPSCFSITSFGADYPVDGLVKRINQGDIIVPRFSLEPEADQSTIGFQREYVWKKPQAERFIESLLLGLPVPGIFLVREANGKHLVLDGQQRLHTLESFYNGLFQGKEFRLENVQERWKNKTYKTLLLDDRRRLDDSIIHATVVRQDEPNEDQSSIYLIFERLNSGGTFLQPQEIRVALYHGPFATTLSAMNENPNWRALYGKKSTRLKDIELILRFLAFNYYASSYRRPVKDFLNRYMATNSSFAKQSKDEILTVFQSVVGCINLNIGQDAFRPKNAVNAAVVDSVMVGIAARLKSGAITSGEALKQAHQTLFQNKTYLELVASSTADEENVRARLQMAIDAFSQVP